MRGRPPRIEGTVGNAALRFRWAAAVLLLLVGASVLVARTRVIQRFFPDGIPGPAPVLTPGNGPGMSAAVRARVVLIDGLSASVARELPTYNRACAQGIDMMVDVGFPTVSLPVQHVLWTGLTQQQSGIAYRIARLAVPPRDGIPRRIPQSVAVAESHRDIVHSFGFAQAYPPLADDTIEAQGSQWRSSGFMATAREVVADDTALAFVHILRVDEAGHRDGAASPAYRRAAEQVDTMLAELIAADPSPGMTRWFLLSDHGHRDQGGHGDAEPEIRLVRACIFGDQKSRVIAEPIHLVDLSRSLLDAVGLGAVARLESPTRGRPLADAIAHPDAGATLPWPPAWRWLIASALGLVGMVASGGWAVRARTLGPLWFPISVAIIVMAWDWPTLSNPVVYPPLGADVFKAAAPGLLWLWWTTRRALRHRSATEVLIGQLAWPLGTTAGVLVLTGLATALVRGVPPLVPFVTGCLCVLGTVVGGAVIAVAVALWPGTTPPRP